MAQNWSMTSISEKNKWPYGLAKWKPDSTESKPGCLVINIIFF